MLLNYNNWNENNTISATTHCKITNVLPLCIYAHITRNWPTNIRRQSLHLHNWYRYWWGKEASENLFRNHLLREKLYLDMVVDTVYEYNWQGWPSTAKKGSSPHCGFQKFSQLLKNQKKVCLRCCGGECNPLPVLTRHFLELKQVKIFIQSRWAVWRKGISEKAQHSLTKVW